MIKCNILIYSTTLISILILHLVHFLLAVAFMVHSALMQTMFSSTNKSLGECIHLYVVKNDGKHGYIHL